MKRLTILLIIFFNVSYDLIAQSVDTIIKKDGTTIQGKVIKVTETQIEFDPKGEIPFQIISRNEVESILYVNGTLVKFNEFKQDLKPATNEAEKLEFVDKNNYKLTELVFGEIQGSCISSQWTSFTFNFNVKSDLQFFSSSQGNQTTYKMKANGSFDVIGISGSIFGKSKPAILFKNIYLNLEIQKEGELVFTRTFYIPNIEIDISRSFIQGREQIAKNISMPEFRPNIETFAYGGVTFEPQLRFYEGAFVWETRDIKDMYQTYRYSLKISIE